ncbi:MAG TPA: hypothetical protein VIN75_05340 [Burkholderiaceae bacterium]
MEYRFDVFGNRVAIRRVGDDWQAFDLGNEGKRRKAGFVVPAFIEVEGLRQYLADLFHESARRSNDQVTPLD